MTTDKVGALDVGCRTVITGIIRVGALKLSCFDVIANYVGCIH